MRVAHEIVCTQCQRTLYEGQPQPYSDGHAKIKWTPKLKGSQLPPPVPPRCCPWCEGSTLQR